MQPNTKFSIIVPVYNVEKYIEECILSIALQSYSNWELILVNDGSSDNSQKICEKFCGEDSRIILLNQENKGVSAARNLGLDKVSGDFVLFVDSDDLLECDTLEKLSGFTDYDVISFCWKKFFRDSAKTQVGGKIFDSNYQFGSKKDIYIKLIDSYELGSVCLKAIKASILNGEGHELRFDENIKYYEDQIFSLQIFLKATSGIFLDDPFYLYRARKSSAINSAKPQKIIDLFRYFEYLQEFAKSTGYSHDVYNSYIADKVINSYYTEMSMIVKSQQDKQSKQKIYDLMLDDNILDILKYYNGDGFFLKLKNALLNKNLNKAIRLISFREFIAKLAGKRKTNKYFL